jgi:nicotinate-nucleotide adenylyltransferase
VIRVRSPRRIGVFGGTFDPPHVGHLLLAESAREALDLTEVWFVPARVPPHKQRRRVTPAATRVALLRAALRGTGFRLDLEELSRRGPSYTVDTLASYRARAPRAMLYLLLGADSLLDLPTWRDPARLVTLARLAVAERPGFDTRLVPARLRRAVDWIPNPPVAIASRDLRARVRTGRSIRFQVPKGVAALVRRLGLYARGPRP